MLEAEVKLSLDAAGRSALLARLDELGAVAAAERAQVDVYFAHPARDFAATDEALRLRRDGTTLRITYKGPKLDPPRKTREEIEFTLATDVETASALLARLGFVAVATVRKRRREFRLDDATPAIVCLDEVEGLGAFCEVECAAPDSVEAGRRALGAALERLGLHEQPPMAASYLELLLARRAR
jgi:adenylate cyclase, class 2